MVSEKASDQQNSKFALKTNANRYIVYDTTLGRRNRNYGGDEAWHPYEAMLGAPPS